MWRKILRVASRGFPRTISRMLWGLFMSDCTEALGREQFSRILRLTRENTSLRGVLPSGRHLRYSPSTLRALLPQNPYYGMHVTLFAVWKRKRHITTLHIDCKNNSFNYEFLCFTYIACILISSKIFIHQLIHKWIVLKTILKFTLKLTLKQLRHVSVQSHYYLLPKSTTYTQ